MRGLRRRPHACQLYIHIQYIIIYTIIYTYSEENLRILIKVQNATQVTQLQPKTNDHYASATQLFRMHAQCFPQPLIGTMTPIH